MSSSSSSSSSINNYNNNNPLFSTFLSFFALILLSFPPLLWSILFSPVFLLAGFLLLFLLRLGAIQQQESISNDAAAVLQSEDEESTPPASAAESEEEDRRGQNDAVTEQGSEGVSCACFEESFVQWNVRAPLEVIYEEGEDHHDPPPRQLRIGIERYPSLSLYYPETDSDSSSEDDEFPAAGTWDSIDDDNVCFMWDEDDEEEEREELIEIALDKTRKKPPSSDHQFQLEEDNLIEIDISPITNNHEFPDVN